MLSVRPRKWITRSGEERKAWVVDYKDRAGKRHIETFSLKKQAEARRKVIEDELDTGSHVPRRESITVEAAAKLWLDAKKKGDAESPAVEASTLRMYRQHVNDFI